MNPGQRDAATPSVSEHGSVLIRKYEPQDREAVRRICCDTADQGKPVERFFPDRAVFADLLSRYYTDFEPESSWVAEHDGRVVGYLTGCVNTERFLRVMCWRIAPVTLVKAICRGTLWKSQTRALLRANLAGWLKSGFRRGVSFEEFPAHLHVNLEEGFRGQKIGQDMVELFVERARAAGARGVHAGVSSENEGGKRFFENLGFAARGSQSRFRHPAHPEREMFTVIYAKTL